MIVLLARVVLSVLLLASLSNRAFAQKPIAFRAGAVAKPAIARQGLQITPNDFALAFIDQVQGLTDQIPKMRQEAVPFASSLVEGPGPGFALNADDIAKSAIGTTLYDPKKNMPPVMEILKHASSADDPQLGLKAAGSLRTFLEQVRSAHFAWYDLSHTARERDGKVIFDGSGISLPPLLNVVEPDVSRELTVTVPMPALKPSSRKSPAARAIRIWKSANTEGIDPNSSIMIPVSEIGDSLEWMSERVETYVELLKALPFGSFMVLPPNEELNVIENLAEEMRQMLMNDQIDDRSYLKLSAQFASAMERRLLFEGEAYKDWAHDPRYRTYSGLHGHFYDIEQLHPFQPEALVMAAVQHGTRLTRSLDGLRELIKILPYPVHFLGFTDKFETADGDKKSPFNFPYHDAFHARLQAEANSIPRGREEQRVWLSKRLELHRMYERGRKPIADRRERRLYDAVWLFLFREIGIRYERESVVKALNDNHYTVDVHVRGQEDPVRSFKGRHFAIHNRFYNRNDLGWMFPRKTPTLEEIEATGHRILEALGAPPKAPAPPHPHIDYDSSLVRFVTALRT